MFNTKIIQTEIEAYILGFLYADGFVTSKCKETYYSVGITLAIKDESIILRLRDIFKSNGYNPVVKYNEVKLKKKIHKAVKLSIHDVKLVDRLISLGISPNKTYEDSSNITNSIDEKNLHHFIRGYFDGDGCITKNGNKRIIKIISLNNSLITFLNDHFVEKCGINKRPISIQSKKYPYVRYSGNVQCHSVGNYLYKDATIFLQRKKDRFDSIPPLFVKKSKYKGVIWHNQQNKWMAKIYIDKSNQQKYLGLFNSEEEANNKITQYKNENINKNTNECP